MSKIVILNGSPRVKGCTAALVEEIVKGASEQGAEVKLFNVNNMAIKGCQSCYVCRTEGRCILQDDMQQLYGEIAEAQGIVFATPVYMWQMTAQLKLVLDRLFPFLRSDHTSRLIPGKKVLLAATQARPDVTIFYQYFEYVSKLLSFLGFGTSEILIAAGTRKPEDVLEQEEIVAEARRLGEWLAIE